MKRMKKFASILLALAMVLGMSLTAFATELNDPSGDPGEMQGQPTTPSTGETATFAGELDKIISVAGLQVGDSVNFYKVLEESQNVGSNGWAPTEVFSTALTKEEWEEVIGNKETKGAISSDVAGKLGKAVTTDITAAYSETVAEGANKIEITRNLTAGLYMAIITPAKPDYTYNPVFVAADYYANSSNTITLEVGQLSYSNNAIAKVTKVGLEKIASKKDDSQPETVGVGDKVSFTITTTIPGFADNYTNPVFKVTDKLSEGLELDTNSIKITDPEDLTLDSHYEIPEGTLSKKGFTLSFKATYLKGLSGATPVVITYDAIVTSEAPSSVNQETNEVTINFSNSPDDTEGHGVLKDKTNHYTFDIDGTLFGEDSYKVTEMVKVGVDKDGNEIKDKVELSNGKVVGALGGAEFKLYASEEEAKKEDGTPYTNKHFDGKVISGEDGRMTIKGLDAGKYWLKETKAPDGYIKAQGLIEIEIVAEIDKDVSVTETTDDGKEVTYKTNVLKSYYVTINGKKTAEYTITNESDTLKSVDKGDVEGDGVNPEDGKIKNTQGVELPSTGGIGTTIFYVVGAILVIGAGILLVVKKRMSNR